jgi:hypothetical protein
LHWVDCLHQLQCAPVNIAAKMVIFRAELQLQLDGAIKAAISGKYAACLRDPFLKDDKIETINHNSDTYLLCRPIARPSQAAQPAAKADK